MSAPAPDARALKEFVFQAVRSSLAARMLDLCLAHRAAYVGVADFARRLSAEPAKVALVLIDWSRQGLFRPSMSGNYCFAAGAEKQQVMQLFRRVWLDERGCKDLELWIRIIEAGKAQSADELPELAEPPAAPTAQPEDSQPAFAPRTLDDLGAKAAAEIRKALSVIPPLPLVAQQLLREAHDPNSSAKSIANVANKDPGIVMSLLKTANSAFYGQNQEITDVQRAIVTIGLNNVKHMLLASGLGRLFKPPAQKRGYDFEALWTHALGTSVAARLLARRTRVMPEAEAGTLGLLHDIGKFAMNVTAPERVEEMLDPFSSLAGLSGLSKEVAIFGTTHAIYGMMVIESWKLPNEVARVAEYHHHPAYAQASGIRPEVMRGVCLVHIANQLAKLGGLECGDRDVESVPDYCFKTLGLSPGLESLLDENMKKTFEQAKYFVSVGNKPRPAASAGAPGAPGAAAPPAKPISVRLPPAQPLRPTSGRQPPPPAPRKP